MDHFDFLGISLFPSKYQELGNIVRYIKSLKIAEEPELYCWCYALNNPSKRNLLQDKRDSRAKFCKYCLPSKMNTEDLKVEKISILQSISSQLSKEHSEASSSVPLKSYQVPFVSKDEEENQNNNDVKWNNLNKLNTLEEFFEEIRRRWRRKKVPDLQEDLSLFIFYKKRGFCIYKCTKRQREDDCEFNPAKRARLFNDLDPYCRITSKKIELVYAEYMAQSNNMYKGPAASRKLRCRYEEKLDQLENSNYEVHIMHKFYNDHPYHIQKRQSDIENQLREEEKFYEKFKDIYRWCGKVFYPGRI